MDAKEMQIAWTMTDSHDETTPDPCGGDNGEYGGESRERGGDGWSRILAICAAKSLSVPI